MYDSGFHIQGQGGLGAFKKNNGAFEKFISLKRSPVPSSSEAL